MSECRIQTAYRLNLTSFEPIFMQLPLERKLKRGRKKAALPALMRQSLSGQEEAPRSIDVASEEDEDDEDDEIAPIATIPKRRGRKPGSGKPAKKAKLSKFA